MPTVIIESPYRPVFTLCNIPVLKYPVNLYRYLKKLWRNKRYLSCCMRDSINNHDESPYASHALLTKYLNDRIPEQRKKGIQLGYAWHDKADIIVFYMDLGMSEGMKAAAQRAVAMKKEIEYRYLIGWNY